MSKFIITYHFRDDKEIYTDTRIAQSAKDARFRFFDGEAPSMKFDVKIISIKRSPVYATVIHNRKVKAAPRKIL